MMNTLCPNVIKSVYVFPYQPKLAISAESVKPNIFCSGCGFKGHERDSCGFKKHPDYNAHGGSYPNSVAGARVKIKFHKDHINPYKYSREQDAQAFKDFEQTKGILLLANNNTHNGIITNFNINCAFLLDTGAQGDFVSGTIRNQLISKGAKNSD
jgi:hypothetical protein